MGVSPAFCEVAERELAPLSLTKPPKYRYQVVSPLTATSIQNHRKLVSVVSVLGEGIEDMARSEPKKQGVWTRSWAIVEVPLAFSEPAERK